MVPSPTPRADHPHVSLDEVHRTVPIPAGAWWRRLFAFAGPAYMVSVGYMDPGNWATDIEGGARFGYKLIWVLLMSNIMAVLLQTLSARLGIVAGRDLAQACRDNYPKPVRYILYVLCEIAIAACDLAEVLGTAIGLNLLFGVPLLWAVLITALDVFILLMIQKLGVRKMEAFILMLVSMVGLCFIVEIFLSKPSPSGIAGGFIPTPLSGDALFVAIGILGATVMPHNLYLHSALVQSRAVQRTREGIREACRFNFIDSAIALNAAFFVNAAILCVAAAAFHSRGIVVDEIQDAHRLLENVLGSNLAPIAFAVALICAGQSSTLTGTLAGQITMEGFLHIRIRPWLRRLMTRSLAIIPAVIVISITGESGTTRLLILSQVILSLQLSFAVIPLVKFTSSKRIMGEFRNPIWVTLLAWGVTLTIAGLNAQLVAEQVNQWTAGAGTRGWLVALLLWPVIGALAILLVWMMFRREKAAQAVGLDIDRVVRAAVSTGFKRIAVAVEASERDAPMLAEAVALARAHRAELILIHVVEGVGGQWYGQQADDLERRADEQYVHDLAARLTAELSPVGVPAVRAVLGYGNVPKQIAEIVRREQADLIVMGGHGHRRLADFFRGETITAVRHNLKVPMLAVKRK